VNYNRLWVYHSLIYIKSNRLCWNF